MPTDLGPERFAVADRLFCDWMQERSGGVPFTSFQHRFLVDDEIAYKWHVYHETTGVVDLGRWPKWKPDSIHIVKDEPIRGAK